MIRSFLPGKLSRKWLGVLLVYTLVLFLVLAGIRLFGINSEIDFSWLAGLLIFSLLVSLVACTFGYFRLLWGFSLVNLGIVMGIITMIISLTGDKNGWEDLIAVAAFLQFTVFGLAAAIIAELIAFLVRRLGSKAR